MMQSRPSEESPCVDGARPTCAARAPPTPEPTHPYRQAPMACRDVRSAPSDDTPTTGSRAVVPVKAASHPESAEAKAASEESAARRDRPSTSRRKHELVHPQGAEQSRGVDSRRAYCGASPVAGLDATSARSSCRPRWSPSSRAARSGSSSGSLSRLPRRQHGDQRRHLVLVRETPGIGDFTGSVGHPTPMLPHEVQKIVAKPEEKTDEAPS